MYKIISNILKEATFERDQAMVNLAKKYISKIKEYLDNYDGKNNNVIEYHGDKGYIIVKVGELEVYLMDARHYRGSSGGYRQNKIASHNIKFKYNPKEHKLTYELNDSTLLHELIHYFDDKKSSKGAVEKAGERQEGGIATKEYFNNPYEFNAHFLQLVLPKVEKYVLKTEEFPNDFDTFKKEIFRGSYKLRDLFDSLTDKNKKRFLKRLYTTYDAIKKGDTKIKKELEDKNLENAPKYEYKKKENLMKQVYKYLKNFFTE